jgi:hypothetical protein
MRRSSDPITNMAATVAEVTAERIRMNKELLQELAFAVAANERAQRRFRTAVLIRLSRIETIAQMVHGAQIVETHHSKPGFEEKVSEHAKDAEEFISQHSDELGLKMVKYVYDEPEAACRTERKTGRKRSR